MASGAYGVDPSALKEATDAMNSIFKDLSEIFSLHGAEESGIGIKLLQLDPNTIGNPDISGALADVCDRGHYECQRLLEKGHDIVNRLGATLDEYYEAENRGIGFFTKILGEIGGNFKKDFSGDPLS